MCIHNLSIEKLLFIITNQMRISNTETYHIGVDPPVSLLG